MLIDRSPFLTIEINTLLAGYENLAPLPDTQVAYANTAVNDFHRALLAQEKPEYQGPGQPMNGWALLGTDITVRRQYPGYNATEYLGRRSICLGITAGA